MNHAITFWHLLIGLGMVVYTWFIYEMSEAHDDNTWKDYIVLFTWPISIPLLIIWFTMVGWFSAREIK